MEINITKENDEFEIFLLPENNCIYINHPDQRFVDVSLGGGGGQVFVSIYATDYEHDSIIILMSELCK